MLLSQSILSALEVFSTELRSLMVLLKLLLVGAWISGFTLFFVVTSCAEGATRYDIYSAISLLFRHQKRVLLCFQLSSGIYACALFFHHDSKNF